MNFNDYQSKIIYDFIIKYNSDEEFKTNVQNLYDNEISKLSILNIYTLEEILRYGNKGIFNKFLETKGEYTEELAIEMFDGFINLLNEDSNFKQYKMDQLKNFPDTLSAMEMFAFGLMNNFEEKKEEIPEEEPEQIREDEPKELEYDSFNSILYATDDQIRETLENLFFGEFIHQMLEVPGMEPIKARQKQPGMIANIDKPFIIKKIRDVAFTRDSLSQFKQIIDNRYVRVKMDILFGKGEQAFEEYLKYNTNINSNEIFGLKKDNSVEDIYDYFVDMINKRKEQGKTK